MTHSLVKRVLCPACGVKVPRAEPHCGVSPILDDRYELHAVVGSGALGTTYEATRVHDGERVAIKQLMLRRIDSTKAISLFEREAETLRKLEHPGIPRYIDHFQWGVGSTIGLYLVQEFIEGQTLAEESETRQYSDEDVFEIAREVSDILDYIHGGSPPVIHRDLKPHNIMRRASDGRLMLIDFGSVRRAVRNVSEGSTISGTIGYMAPEQLHGQASPATDMFGLGMTMAALRTGSDPGELLMTHGHDWRDEVTLGRQMNAVLDGLTADAPDHRPVGGEALDHLITRSAETSLAPVGETAPGVVVEPPFELRKWVKKNGWVVQSMAILTLLGFGFVSVSDAAGFRTGVASLVLLSLVMILFSTAGNPM